MSIKKIRTKNGDIGIDYNGLDNLPVIDQTLEDTSFGRIADAGAVVQKLQDKIGLPIINGVTNYGNSGEVLISNGDGTFSWYDISLISSSGQIFSDTGIELHLQNTIETPLKNFYIYGKSSQSTTPAINNQLQIKGLVSDSNLVVNFSDVTNEILKSIEIPQGSIDLHGIENNNEGNILVDGNHYVADILGYKRGTPGILRYCRIEEIDHVDGIEGTAADGTTIMYVKVPVDSFYQQDWTSTLKTFSNMLTSAPYSTTGTSTNITLSTNQLTLKSINTPSETFPQKNPAQYESDEYNGAAFLNAADTDDYFALGHSSYGGTGWAGYFGLSEQIKDIKFFTNDEISLVNRIDTPKNFSEWETNNPSGAGSTISLNSTNHQYYIDNPFKSKDIDGLTITLKIQTSATGDYDTLFSFNNNPTVSTPKNFLTFPASASGFHFSNQYASNADERGYWDVINNQNNSLINAPVLTITIDSNDNVKFYINGILRTSIEGSSNPQNGYGINTPSLIEFIKSQDYFSFGGLFMSIFTWYAPIANISNAVFIDRVLSGDEIKTHLSSSINFSDGLVQEYDLTTAAGRENWSIYDTSNWTAPAEPSSGVIVGENGVNFSSQGNYSYLINNPFKNKVKDAIAIEISMLFNNNNGDNSEGSIFGFLRKLADWKYTILNASKTNNAYKFFGRMNDNGFFGNQQVFYDIEGASSNLASTVETWFKLKIIASKNIFQIYINDELVEDFSGEWKYCFNIQTESSSGAGDGVSAQTIEAYNTFLSNNPLKILVPCKTPEFESVSTEIFSLWNELSAYSEQTNITNNLDAIMTAQYIASQGDL